MARKKQANLIIFVITQAFRLKAEEYQSSLNALIENIQDLLGFDDLWFNQG